MAAAFEAWAADASTQIFEWANPGSTTAERATAGWALTRLDHALYALAAYLVIVAAGVIRKANTKPLSDADKKAIRDAEKKETVMQSFSREPVKIVQVIYNAVQVVLCATMIAGTVQEYRRQNYTLICNSFKLSNTGMAFWTHIFYLSKVLDFADTLFMVVRGKMGQFSFLHTYHHITIFLVYWLNTSVASDGDIYFTILANGTVHLVMYTYYLLTSFKFRPPWKMAVTLLQLVQFVSMNAQAIYMLQNNCAFPRNITLVYLFYIMSLFALFMNFFIKSYLGGKGKGKGKKPHAA